MKRLLVILTLLALPCLKLNSENLKITDFKTPKTEADRFYLDTWFNLQSEEYLVLVRSNFNLTYSEFYTSLPFSYFLITSLNVAYNDYNEDLGPNTMSSDNDKSISPKIEFNIQKYFSEESDLYIGGKFMTKAQYYRNEQVESSTIHGLYALGLGYGRIIEATSMARALRIQEYLLSEGQLTGETDKKTVLEIAEHCDRISEYSYKYQERYESEWFKDLEKIMVKSGKLADGHLNPFSVIRIFEVLNREMIWYRPVGWRLETNLLYQLDDNLKHESGYMVDSYGAELDLNIGYPINNKLHFSNNTFYRYTNLFEGINQTSNFIFSSTQLTYNLTNLIDLNLQYIFQTRSGESYTTREHYLIFGADYYVENKIIIGLDYNFTNYYTSSNFSNNDRSRNTLNIGFKYKFW